MLNIGCLLRDEITRCRARRAQPVRSRAQGDDAASQGHLSVEATGRAARAPGAHTEPGAGPPDRAPRRTARRLTRRQASSRKAASPVCLEAAFATVLDQAVAGEHRMHRAEGRGVEVVVAPAQLLADLGRPPSSDARGAAGRSRFRSGSAARWRAGRGGDFGRSGRPALNHWSAGRSCSLSCARYRTPGNTGRHFSLRGAGRRSAGAHPSGNTPTGGTLRSRKVPVCPEQSVSRAPGPGPSEEVRHERVRHEREFTFGGSGAPVM